MSVSTTPQAPRIGELVTFRVVVDDPDAPINDCIPGQHYGDGSFSPGCVLGASPAQFGRWAPVVRPGHLETTFQHTYTKTGSFVATFGFSSSACGDARPYSSDGPARATVVVAACAEVGCRRYARPLSPGYLRPGSW